METKLCPWGLVFGIDFACADECEECHYLHVETCAYCAVKHGEKEND